MENELLDRLETYKNMHLSLDMTRGKPCKAQLDLSLPMMDVLSSSSKMSSDDNFDCRNYGVLDGLPECKKLLGDMIEVDPKNIIIYGNSSLQIMYDLIAHAITNGICGCTPWGKLEKVKWLCPVPGYDRHFAITEHFGFEMINIPINGKDPDMDMIEEYIKDPAVKGIWCIPKYSNPTGETYSEETVKRFARLRPAAKDFRIYWDNAYSVHHLYEDKQDFIPELLHECELTGNPDLVYKFTSTSKITFPGSGIAALATSDNNIKDVLSYLKYQTIGFDKVNQLRHVRFFKDLDGIKNHMKKHAEIMQPKFKVIDDIFSKYLTGIASWTKPNGGYFITLCVPNKAKEVVEECGRIGVKMTEAGAMFPYHKDPTNSYIRIAPSFPTFEEVELAANIIALVAKYQLTK